MNANLKRNFNRFGRAQISFWTPHCAPGAALWTAVARHRFGSTVVELEPSANLRTLGKLTVKPKRCRATAVHRGTAVQKLICATPTSVADGRNSSPSEPLEQLTEL